MPWSLRRYQQSGQTHYLTFSCYRRLPKLVEACLRDLAVRYLNPSTRAPRVLGTPAEQTRIRFRLRVYDFVIMPEHVHLLVSEPEKDSLAVAMQSFKLAVTKRAPAVSRGRVTARVWHKRYYDHNVGDYDSFVGKLRYIHRNPVKRGLCAKPEDWKWSSFRHYATGEDCGVEIESEWTARRREREVRVLTPPRKTAPR
jgi:putative transposase